MTVSIVNYATPADAADCAKKAHEALSGISHEILVWDNAPEESEVLLGLDLECLGYSRDGRNLGFGRGNNKNLDAATGQYFLVLNPDVEINREAVVSCLSTLEAKSSIAAVTPLLRNLDGTVQASNRKFPSLRTELARVFGLDRTKGSSFSTLLDLRPGSGLVAVDQPAGASILVRTSLLKTLGGFSADYALYFEDVDLARRLSRHGSLVVDTEHSFTHASEGTAKLVRMQTIFWIERNRIRYHFEHTRGISGPLCIVLAGISAATHGIIWLLLSMARRSESRREALSRARGYFLGPASWLLGSERHWRKTYLGIS